MESNNNSNGLNTPLLPPPDTPERNRTGTLSLSLETTLEELDLTDFTDGNQPDGGKTKVQSGLKRMQIYQNLRHQFAEQLKFLAQRLDSQISTTSELQSYFKRRSEVETEVAKLLESRLLKTFNFKRRDSSQWSPSMLSNLMVSFENETKKEATQRQVLAEICGLIANRLGLISEDLQRIFKQCLCVCQEGQEELVKVLQELYSSSKEYAASHQEFAEASAKLKASEAAKSKAEVGLSKEKIEKSKKVKALDKDVQKRRRKVVDLKFKALRFRNEYSLNLDAANAAVQKYFVDDLSDIIDCMDLGYYESIGACLRLYVYSEEIKKDSLGTTIENLTKMLTSLDSKVDKQKFLEAHNSSFVLPKRFEFWQFLPPGEMEQDPSSSSDQPPGTLVNLETPPVLQEELEQRMYLLERRLIVLKTEANETWKTLETCESTLIKLIEENWSCNVVREWFAVGGTANNGLLGEGKEGNLKFRSDRVETDQFHINKYRDWMLSTSKCARLEAKYDHIKSALGIKRSIGLDDEINASEKMKRRKRIGRISANCRLFGGGIEDYLEANKCEIPLIIKSCIRQVNLFGMQHQGIFRVSGSQVEIQKFRDAFERGEDPLRELTDASDINSVASLLKLYLRELREPLMPLVFFDFLMELAELDNDQLFTQKMHLIMKSIPRPVWVVLRYLFHFLNHLTENAEKNMMDPYNLAICFGPTLIQVPEDKNLVQYQNLINSLTKNIIVYAHEIFPNDGSGELYRKYCDDSMAQTSSSSQHVRQQSTSSCGSSSSSRKNRFHIRTNNSTTDDEQSSAEDYELPINALAMYDFKGRSARELNLKKGQNLRLVIRVSSEWWKGVILDGDQEDVMGLIPHKYIYINDPRHSKGPPPMATTPPTAHSKKLSISDPPLTPTELGRPHKLKLLPTDQQQQASTSSGSTTIVHINAVEVGKTNGERPPSSNNSNGNRLSLETKFTPDLVLDLPASATNVAIESTKTSANSGSSIEKGDSPGSSSSSDESEVTVVTGAEVFAKQNQCTLKKINAPVGNKPKVMAKPKLPIVVATQKDEEDDEEEEHDHKKTEK